MTDQPTPDAEARARLIAELRDTLRPYIAHRSDCTIWRTNPDGDYCTCGVQEAVNKADRLVADLLAAEGWRDIRTAPKDGTAVLCTWVYQLSDGRVHWSNVMHVLSWWANWHGAGQGAWVLDGDFAAHFAPDGYHETPPIQYGEPTHWMPLPAPPRGTR